MIYINKTTFSVLVFFILAFSIFLFIKPETTGMVTVAPTLNQTTYFSNSLIGGTAVLTFKSGDAIPATAKITLAVVNSTLAVTGEDNGVKLSSTTKDISTVITSVTSSALTADTEINSPDAPWESKTTTVYSFLADTPYTIDLKDFNLNVPEITGWNLRSYDIIVNLTWLCTATDGGCTPDTNYNISSKRTNIIVRSNNLSLIDPPTILNISGANKFKVNDYINCTAKITDVNSDIPTNITAKFWGPSKTQSTPSDSITWTSSDYTKCSSDAWSAGKTCSLSTQITSSKISKDTDFGYWNCSISVHDGYDVNTSINSFSILTLNNTFVNFTGKLINLSWYNDISKDSAFNLYSSSLSGDGFYDPDSTLNFTVVGNSSINVTINSNGNVDFVGKYRNTTGIFQIFFNATENLTRDSSLPVSIKSNNITINISKRPASSCTQNWNCSTWSICTASLQSRICTDLNSCGNETNKPNITQTCTVSTSSSGGSDSSDTIPSPSTPTTPSAGSSSSADQQAGAAASTSDSTTSTKNMVLIIGIIAGVASLGGAGYFLYQYATANKKPVIDLPQETKEVKKEEISFTRTIEEKPVTIANIDELKKFVSDALKNKTPIPKIKENLKQAGWKEDQIQDSINLVSLKNFIQMKLNQGMKRENIVETLKLKGWKEDVIAEAFKDVSEKPMI